MAAGLGMDVSRVRGLASQLTAQLSTIDQLISELSTTAKAADNPLSYGIDPGEQVVARWSASTVRSAKTELKSARGAIEVMLRRVHVETEAQIAASGNVGTTYRIVGAHRKNGSLSKLSDAELLTYLAGLSAKELADALAADPGIEDRLAEMPPDLVAGWWNAYDKSQKNALIAAMPQVLGNLEGVEYWARDKANRAYLRAASIELESWFAQYASAMARNDFDTMQRILDESGYTAQGLVSAYGASLKIAAALKDLPDGGAQPSIRQLVSLDLEGDVPLAAISIGDLDAADNISLLVPGVTTTVQDHMGGWTTTAENLWVEQNQVLARAGDDRNIAVVAWLGYDTPGSVLDGDFGVFNDDAARAGGAHLAQALAGVSASRGWEPTDSRLDVVALSYGSTTAFSALTDGSAGTLVVLGSTGPVDGIDTVADVNVRDGQVWATESRADGVADIGRWTGRLDPTSDDFGANDFSSEKSDTREATTEHGGMVHFSEDDNFGYLDLGTESIRNVAFITLDMQPSETPPVPPPRSTPGGNAGPR